MSDVKGFLITHYLRSVADFPDYAFYVDVCVSHINPTGTRNSL